MIPVSLFHNCFANLNLWISHPESVLIPLFNVIYPSHKSWIVWLLSMSGFVILCKSVLSLLAVSWCFWTKKISSFNVLLWKSEMLYFLIFLSFSILRNTLRLSFLSLFPSHSGHAFISSIAWKSTVNNHFAYWSLIISSTHL